MDSSGMNPSESDRQVPQRYSDEIDLYELWQGLMRQKWVIVVTTALFLIVAVAACYLIPETYRANAYFLPPLKKDVDALNIPDVTEDYTVEGVYQEFQRSFRSRDALWRFYQQRQLWDAYLSGEQLDKALEQKAFEKGWLQAIALHLPKGKDADEAFVSASLDWNAPTEAEALLSDYIQMVSAEVATRFLDEVADQVQSKRETIEEKIVALRLSAESSRLRQLVVLEENIAIARRLGISKATTLDSAYKSTGVVVDASGRQPMYAKGYEVLEAERDALLAREDNDPFTPGLDALLATLDYLKTIELSADEISVVRISQPATALPDPVKPNNKLIVAVGLVLGVFAGLVLALIRNAIASRREQAAQ